MLLVFFISFSAKMCDMILKMNELIQIDPNLVDFISVMYPLKILTKY